MLVTDNENIEFLITDLIHRFGIPAHINGHNYIREAVLLSIDNPQLSHRITKYLYPIIADKFVTTPSRVERSIRHAIELAWTRADMTLIEKYFGYSVNPDKGKPTNKEFICLLTDRIRMQMKVKMIG